MSTKESNANEDGSDVIKIDLESLKDPKILRFLDLQGQGKNSYFGNSGDTQPQKVIKSTLKWYPKGVTMDEWSFIHLANPITKNSKKMIFLVTNVNLKIYAVFQDSIKLISESKIPENVFLHKKFPYPTYTHFSIKSITKAFYRRIEDQLILFSNIGNLTVLHLDQKTKKLKKVTEQNFTKHYWDLSKTSFYSIPNPKSRNQFEIWPDLRYRKKPKKNEKIDKIKI